MDEQFIDRVINILIEQHKLRPDNFGGRGQSGGQLKDPASRARAAKTLRLKRGLDKVGAPKAPTMKEESTVLDRVIKILIERTDLPEPTKANGNDKLRARYQGAGREMKMAGGAAGYASSRLAHHHYHKYRGRRHEQPVNHMGSSEQERRRDAGRRYINNLVSTGNQGTGLPSGQLRVGKDRNHMYGPYAKRATISNPQETRQLILNKFAKILAEGKRSKALARATNPNKINKLKASQERGDSKRALKAGKGGEDALNRMFGIGKRGS